MGYPCFLRTGETSNKHAWNETCKLASADDLAQHVVALVEFSFCADFLGLSMESWVVRKWLDLETSFACKRYCGFPVNKERRYFIESGKVLCHHPYWPVGAVEQGEPDDLRWLEKLAVLNREDLVEVDSLTFLSEQVAKQFAADGAWSLDWACDRKGKWIAIDMAQAERSFHWPNCHVAKERKWPR